MVEQRRALFCDLGGAGFEFLVFFHFLRPPRGQLFKLFERIGRAAVPGRKFVSDDLQAQDTGFRFLVEAVVGAADFGQRCPLFCQFALLSFYLGAPCGDVG